MLYGLAILWFVALVIESYRDNLPQSAGLIGLILWALGRANALWNKEDIGPYQILLHVSLVLLSLGTAWKVWKFRGTPNVRA